MSIATVSMYPQSRDRWTITIPAKIKEEMLKDGLSVGQYLISYSKETGLRLNPSEVIVQTIKRNAPGMICYTPFPINGH